MIDDDGWQVRGAVVADAGLLTGLVGDGAEAARMRTLIADPARFIPVAQIGAELVGYAEAQYYGPALRRGFGVVDHDAQAEQADIDAEWDEEIQRRVEELLSGTVQPVSGRESFARIRSRLDELHR